MSSTNVPNRGNIIMFLNGFNYRKTKEILGSNYGDLVDYSMKVIRIIKGSGTDTQGGDSRVIQEVYVGQNARDDFGDVRFTDINNNELSYFMENKVDGIYADFVIKIPIILSSVTTEIYIYYNNPTVTTTSNGYNTFIFYDDFKSYPLGSIHNQGGWDVRAVGGIGGYAEIREYNNVKHASIISDDFTIYSQTIIMHSLLTSPDISISARVIYPGDLQAVKKEGIFGFCNYNIGFKNRAQDSYQYYYNTEDINVWKMVRWSGGTATVYSTGESGITPNEYYTYEFSWYSNNFKSYKNNAFISMFTDTKFGSFPYLSLSAYPSNLPAYFDYIYVRKYVEPEPSWGITYPEETSCENPIISFDIV